MKTLDLIFLTIIISMITLVAARKKEIEELEEKLNN